MQNTQTAKNSEKSADDSKNLENFTFIHLADCHLGSWRDDKLRRVGFDSFAYVIDAAIKQAVDFVIIAGDLFNTALPAIDVLKDTVTKLQELKAAGIPAYIIAGSHDYSPTGKTMLDVLEEAHLVTNTLVGDMENESLKLKFIVDPKTGAKLCGILGRAQGLEKQHYRLLDRAHIERETGFRIFLFHTTISELKPTEMADAVSTELSYLPKGFNYYAGGHVHTRLVTDVEEYGRIVYPGPTFPNNFSEIEKLHTGSFVVNTVVGGKIVSSTQELIKLHPHVGIVVDVSGHSAESASERILAEKSRVASAPDCIVTLRVSGKLTSGSPSDIEFERIVAEFLSAGAFTVLRNTATLEGVALSATVSDVSDLPSLEEKIIREHIGQVPSPFADEVAATRELMQLLSISKAEGETSKDFEQRLVENAKDFFGWK